MGRSSHPVRWPVVRHHRDEVDYTVEVGFLANRELDDRRSAVEAILDHMHRSIEVCAGAIHLVHEADARNVVAIGLTPHRFGLGLDSCNRIEHGNRPVEHPQAALHLDREVDVTRSVDDVDPVGLPMSSRRGRGDGDPALLLLNHPVHDGRALVDLADLVGLAGVVEDALGRGGLARINVGHDPDIARAAKGRFADDRAPATLHLAQVRAFVLLLLLCCLSHRYHL